MERKNFTRKFRPFSKDISWIKIFGSECIRMIIWNVLHSVINSIHNVSTIRLRTMCRTAIYSIVDMRFIRLSFWCCNNPIKYYIQSSHVTWLRRAHSSIDVFRVVNHEWKYEFESTIWTQKLHSSTLQVNIKNKKKAPCILLQNCNVQLRRDDKKFPETYFLRSLHYIGKMFEIL